VIHVKKKGFGYMGVS